MKHETTAMVDRHEIRGPRGVGRAPGLGASTICLGGEGGVLQRLVELEHAPHFQPFGG